MPSTSKLLLLGAWSEASQRELHMGRRSCKLVRGPWSHWCLFGEEDVASATVVGSILGIIVEWSAEQIYEYSLLLAEDSSDPAYALRKIVPS